MNVLPQMAKKLALHVLGLPRKRAARPPPPQERANESSFHLSPISSYTGSWGHKSPAPWSQDFVEGKRATAIGSQGVGDIAEVALSLAPMLVHVLPRTAMYAILDDAV